MAEIVIAVVGKVAEYLVAPIGRQLGYLFCYRSYTDGLRNNVQKLGKARDDLKITVDEARQTGNETRPIVQDWMNRVDLIAGEAEKLLSGENNKSCFNLKSRYKLGRQAYKKAQQAIAEIQEGRNFPEGISYRVPPRSATFKGCEPFESRSSTLDEIMDALRDDAVKMIGVWGMGGVGKTTLVKQVAKLVAQDKNLFDQVVMAYVSQTADLNKIQAEIADALGLKLDEEGGSGRAGRLSERLKKEKKVLIILDDLWAELDLAAVGIPSHREGCKIMLTSRRLSVLSNEMGTQKNFHVEQLSEEEAWSLFKKTSGDHSIENKPIARKVLRKCGGLPLAIVIVAKALKGKDLICWKDALLQLEQSIETTIEGIEARIFAPLEFSYDKLYGDEVKSLFLLCGLLDYGYTRIDDLFKFGVGLHLFQNVDTLQEARDRLHTLINNLRASSLLLESSDSDDNGNYVRMHDVVRQVARAIASKDPYRFIVKRTIDDQFEEWSNSTDESQSCNGLSLNCSAGPKLPQVLVYPQLNFFLLQGNSDPSLKIPNSWFDRMEKLQVLALFNLPRGSSLPSSFSSLSNIQTLCLHRCGLGDIALIGKLTRLRVLSMAGSDIKQLPQEMAQLNYLRLLDLSHCFSLRVIPRNILSSMSRLECLFMKSSFSKWAAEEDSNEGNNACLSELNHLPHLMALEIEVPKVKLVPEEDKFLQNLTSFSISIGNTFGWSRKVHKKSNSLCLQGGDGSLLLRNGMGKLLEKTETLGLTELEQVFSDPLSVRSLGNLKTFKVKQCHGLKILFSLSIAGTGLPHLEKMTIKDCDAMQQILTFQDDQAGTNLQLFSELRSLKLYSLPVLMNFGCFNSELEATSQGNLDIDMPFFSSQVLFPKIEILQFNKLPKLKEIWHHQLPIDSFSNLQILRVENCRCLLNMIPCHLVGNLKNLKEIIVKNCEVLQHVFDLHDDSNGEILPRLETLKLENLVNLKGIICNNDKNDSFGGDHSPAMSESFHNSRCLSIVCCGKEGKDVGNVSIPTEDGVHFGKKGKNDKLRYFLSHFEIKNFLHLKELHIINCGKSLDEKVSLSPNLEVLVLESFFKLKEIDFGISPKLKILKLNKLPKLRRIICNDDKNGNQRRNMDENVSNSWLFSPSTFKNFSNLKEVSFYGCGAEDRRDGDASANGAVLSNEKVPFLESRASTLNEIMNALRGDNINSIAAVGIGGVGKTTLVKQVARQAKQQHLFTNQVYIDLSSSTTRLSDVFNKQREVISDIQQKIAEKLFWNYKEWYKNERERAIEMRQRLKKEKMLIILDDIWKEIDLDEIGIPYSCKDDDDDVKQCKIVLTCGDEQYIGAQKCFPVKPLPREEAWALFKKTASGADSMVVEKNNNPEEEVIRSVAIQVFEECCEGLPLAILPISRALKDATLAEWKDALEHLRNCLATAGGKKAVYSSCLEWSYTHLKHDDLKSLLLLCGSLSYGDISLYHLLQYAVGLDSFDRIDSLQQARDRLLELVEILKASGWLLEGHVDLDGHNFDEERDSSLLFLGDSDNKFVRMHHVVYDVVRDIASKDPRPFVLIKEDARLEEWSKTDESKRCNFISLHSKVVEEQLPPELVCPELQFFLLQNNNPSLNIPDTFFQGMKKLQVLDLPKMSFKTIWSGTSITTLLPSSLHSLANLHTLRLDGCMISHGIAGIGKLKKLKILSLRGSSIQQLPDEMAQLSNLRLLDLNRCWHLNVIPRNILSSLSRLECLRMRESFSQWALPIEGDHQSINANNACLSELNHLSCLTTLSIELADAQMLLKDIRFENLTRYAIFIGGDRNHLWGCRTNRTLKLKKVIRSSKLEDEISKLFEISKELEFKELSGTNHVLYLSHEKSFAELEHLEVGDSPEIEYIIDPANQLFLEHGALTRLESLVLQNLKNLKEIWHGSIPTGSFRSLKTLEVFFCPKLTYLLSVSIARGLSQLENMRIIRCQSMERIIAYKRESEDAYDKGGTNLELFPNLRTLQLQELPELINFSSELETSSSCFTHKVSFSKLEILKLYGVPKLKDVWNPQHPHGPFSNLRILDVHPNSYSN